jgi:natural product precursor
LRVLKKGLDGPVILRFNHNTNKMKKLSLEMLRLTSADILERSQMKNITGGNGFYACSCSGGPESTVMISDDSYPADAMVECNVVIRCRRLS